MGFDSQAQSLLNALSSMTAGNTDYDAGPIPSHNQPMSNSLNRSHGTDSSLDNSPYNSSPSLISPVYDPSIGPPMPYGNHSTIPHNLHVQAQATEDYGWTSSSSMPLASAIPANEHRPHSYEMQSFPQQLSMGQQQYQVPINPTMGYQGNQDMGYMSQAQQPPQGPSGRYVFQPDGSQIYIPYGQE
jgi:hypothetical protein